MGDHSAAPTQDSAPQPAVDERLLADNERLLGDNKRLLADNARLLAAGRDVLEREACCLDEQRWDDWLALYAEDCEYWVPTWLTEETLTSDPQAQLSHIYYANRAGLEDRLVRIRSGRSPASFPLRRTAHLLANVRLDGVADERTIPMRSTWTSHVFDPRHKKSYLFFGRAHYLLEQRGGDWKIAKKKTIIQNDYLPSMVDIYCI
ncbi:MAG: benzene 1,2-dioxygenase [Betaproteobacteria bacterium]|nr:benzene 1,2-dioxygenase [Betaproteobacteria bacterium]